MFQRCLISTGIPGEPKVSGDRVRDIRMKDGVLDLGQVINFTPGQYRLREASNPAWVCNINITPPR